MNYIVIKVDASIEEIDRFIKDTENSGIVNSRDNEEGLILPVKEVLKIEGKRE